MKGPEKGFLKLDVFCKVIDDASEHLIVVNFADWGEPFLNPQIFRMIRHAEDKKIMTHASTNLHQFKNEDDLRNLLNCGLSFLIISLHGVSQETYAAYQPGKSFNATIEKIKILVNLRKQLKRKKPIINLAFAITKKNQHEIKKMRWFAEKLGVDSAVYTASLNLRFYVADSSAMIKMVSEWAQDSRLDKRRIGELYEAIKKHDQINFDVLDRLRLSSRHFCLDPWQSLTVNWDGTVSLCCTDYGKYFMGDTHEESIIRIWNNERYRTVRKFLLGELSSTNVDFPCKYCIRY